jgi:NACHT domain
VLQLDEFQQWLNQPTPSTLWLSGDTGFGKSVLAAHVLSSEYLIEKFPSAVVSYFFCSGSNEYLRQLHHIILTFLAHLTLASESVRMEIKKHWSGEQDLGPIQARSKQEITNFFEKVVIQAIQHIAKEAKPIFFIIDGINECPNNLLLGILHFVKLLRYSKAVRILITSQAAADIAAELQTSDNVDCKELTSEDNDCLITQFIRESLKRHPELLKSFTRVNIPDPVEYFRTRHRGMFLWVSTLMEELPKKCSREEDFTSTLKNVPGKMNAVFQQALGRLVSYDTAPDILELLTRVALSRKDMRV